MFFSLKLFNVIFFAVVIIMNSSCNTGNKNRNDFKNKNEKTSYFLDNESVEVLINNNDPLFLSYWVGMSKKEATEVTRYLLEKEIISGIVYDSGDDSTYVKYCSDFSLDALLEKNCPFVEFNSNNYYLLWQDNAQSFRVLIEHTLFEIQFNYSELNGINSLSSIFLLAAAESTGNSGIQYSDYMGITRLYSEKYGQPESSYFKAPSEGHCSYKIDDKEIKVYYNSANKSERFENFYSPSQIHIDYYDIRRKQDEFDYQNKTKEKENREHKQEMKRLDEKAHSESLKKI